MQYKIGDKVKIVGTSKSCSGCQGKPCYFLGRIGTISDVEGYRYSIRDFSGTDEWCTGFDKYSLEKPIIKPYPIVDFLNGGKNVF